MSAALSQLPVNKVKYVNKANRANKEVKCKDLRQIKANIFQYNFRLLPLLLVSPPHVLLWFISLAIRDTLEFWGKKKQNKANQQQS